MDRLLNDILTEVHQCGLALRFSKEKNQFQGQAPPELLERIREKRAELFQFLSDRHWRPFTLPGRLDEAERVETVTVKPSGAALEVSTVYQCKDGSKRTVQYFFRPKPG